MSSKLVILFCLYYLKSFCQLQVNPDFLFIEHLTNVHKHKDAVFLLHHDKNSFDSDTNHYLLGYNYHFLKVPDSANHYFNMVSNNSSFNTASRFLQSLNQLYSKKNNTYQVLDCLANDTLRKYIQVYYMIKSANFLLQGNYKAFDSISSKFSFDNFIYSNEQTYLIDLKSSLSKHKNKSPLVAGLLSAAVPGLGKFYAGKKGAALSAFFINLVLGGIAYENYYRAGYKSPQFIFFGSLFAFFYTGNIVGSVYSVKQYTNSFNGKINNEIIATIHVPINRLFVR